MRNKQNNITGNIKIIDSTQEILKSYNKTKKNKRPRIRLTDAQRNALENAYVNNQHPTNEVKEFLEYKYLIPIKNVQIWFQNRRAKQKSINEQLFIDNMRQDPSVYSRYKNDHDGRYMGFYHNGPFNKENDRND